MRDRRRDAHALQLGRFSETATASECAELVQAFSTHARRRRTKALLAATVGFKTPVLRGAEAAATLRAVLDASATGRHARGPLLARRLLERRGVAAQAAVRAVGELERSGAAHLNKTLNRRLISMSQILEVVLGALESTGGARNPLLSPSGVRRLRRRDMHASRIRRMLRMPDERASAVAPLPSPSMAPLSASPDTSPKSSLLVADREPRTRTQEPFAGLLRDLAPGGHQHHLQKKKRPTFVGARAEDDDRNLLDDDGEIDKTRKKKRVKDDPPKTQPCALCLHVFPVESLPSSSTVGEIERMRKAWGERQRKRLAGETMTGKATSSVIENIRFQMSTEKKLAELGMGIEVLASVTKNTTRRFRPPSDRPFSSGAFQVMAVRKPICILCHNILGRDYDVSGNWEKEGSAIDPPPKPKWLRLHGLAPKKKTGKDETLLEETMNTIFVGSSSSGRRTSTRRRRRPKGIEPVEWLEMKKLGIYEDEDASSSSSEEDEVIMPSEEEPASGDEGEPVTEAQMKKDLEVLLREQQLMLDELRELELARQEVKERKKIVHAKRRDRLRKKAQNDSNRHLAFFTGRG